MARVSSASSYKAHLLFVLATFPLLAGVFKAPLLFDLVFFVVLASVLLQGTTAPLVARWLGVVVAPAKQV